MTHDADPTTTHTYLFSRVGAIIAWVGVLCGVLLALAGLLVLANGDFYGAFMMASGVGLFVASIALGVLVEISLSLVLQAGG